MVRYDIGLEHKDTGEVLAFDLKAGNGSEAIGKILEGKVKLAQPHPDDPRKTKIQAFIPDGSWKITRMDTAGKEYPEMVGRHI